MKTVLITGTSSGIGKATAEKFLAEGWLVIGTSTSGFSDSENENLTMHKLDLSDQSSIAEFVKKLEIAGAKIDVLINNAGISPKPDTEQIDIPTLRKTLEVNLLGLITLTESLLNHIVSGGSILNISSTAGFISSAMKVPMTGYRISKSGVNMYTHTLAQRLMPQKIVVSAYNPGWVRTRLNGNQGKKEPMQAAEEIYALTTENKETDCFWNESEKMDWSASF